MANQLGKFSSNLAELSQPISTLLNPRTAWVWGPGQEDCFNVIKSELAKPTTLALYDPVLPTNSLLILQHTVWEGCSFRNMKTCGSQ